MLDTSYRIAEDARRDDPAVRSKQSLQFALAHRLGDAADVQVGSLDVLAAGPSEGNLKRGKLFITLSNTAPCVNK